MILIIEETKRRVNYLKKHGFFRRASSGEWFGEWCGLDVHMKGFLYTWRALMKHQQHPDDWNPPESYDQLFYDQLDCSSCHNSRLVEISRAIKEALRTTINKHCTCGGREPSDPSCCSACHVWHDLYNKPTKTIKG
jgi:hypothetical protein